MNIINFVSGGQLGDLIHELFVVKNICSKNNFKANLYIVDISYNIETCGNFTYDLEKTYNDLYDLIVCQDYINFFGILPKIFNENFINLCIWRNHIEATKINNQYSKCWTDILKDTYNLKIENSDFTNWLTVNDDDYTKDKVLIHRSIHRHNPSFDWNFYLDKINDDILFITTNEHEWNIFPYKRENIKIYLKSNIFDITRAINSCKYFIGNQSSNFAIACSLNIPRLVELSYGSDKFYSDEKKYHNNISYYYDDNNKYYSKNFLI